MTVVKDKVSLESSHHRPAHYACSVGMLGSNRRLVLAAQYEGIQS